MRIFIAIDIDESTRKIIAESLKPTQQKIKSLSWTTPEQWHLTLAFLGEVEPPLVLSLQKRLAQIESLRFVLRIGEIGVFPNWANPRVFWAGVSENKEMQILHTRLWDMLQQEGFSPDEKGFHPHLTLARIKKPISLEEKKILQTANIPQTEVHIENFHLYQSELLPQGARYTKLMTYPLKEKPNG
ncbi:MAG: RNA 2',3'-cyclic phosphodiesterase [Brevinematales bacterium]